MFSSCEVRKPSKKCTNGTRVSSVAACATSARSWASCTDADASSAKPVWRTAITSEWSPKIDSPCAASERAATCSTAEVSSPAILYMFGIISSRPCEAVNVVASAPPWSAPCSAPAAPASLCISITAGTVPHTFGCPWLDHSSASSAIGEDGVIGIDAADLVAAVGDRRRRFVAVDGGAHQLGSAIASGRRTNASGGVGAPSGNISIECTGHCSKHARQPVQRS